MRILGSIIDASSKRFCRFVKILDFILLLAEVFLWDDAIIDKIIALFCFFVPITAS